MKEAKSKALKKKMEEKEGKKKCKYCGSTKHMANECDEKEKGDEEEGREEKREEE